MTDYAKASVAHVARVTPTSSKLRLSLERSEVAAAHVVPGQYVKLSVPGRGESTFAIASRPGSGTHFDFLLKHGSAVADALAAASPGDAVLISPVTGRGFALASARGSDVLLVATGSGVSAIRSAIDVIRVDRKAFGRVWLLFGTRTPQEFAFSDEFDRWRHDQIEVVPIVSRPDGTWKGETGRVQDHLPRDLDARRTWALLCGSKAMLHDMGAALVAYGIPKERILLNF